MPLHKHGWGQQVKVHHHCHRYHHKGNWFSPEKGWALACSAVPLQKHLCTRNALSVRGCEILPGKKLVSRGPKREGALCPRGWYLCFCTERSLQGYAKNTVFGFTSFSLNWQNSKWKLRCQKLALFSTKADRWITIAPVYMRFSLKEHRLLRL